MTVQLASIDALQQDLQLDAEHYHWLTLLVDTLNENLTRIQEGLNANNNGLLVAGFTTAEINDLATQLPANTMALYHDTDTGDLKKALNGVVTVV